MFAVCESFGEVGLPSWCFLWSFLLEKPFSRVGYLSLGSGCGCLLVHYRSSGGSISLKADCWPEGRLRVTPNCICSTTNGPEIIHARQSNEIPPCFKKMSRWHCRCPCLLVTPVAKVHCRVFFPSPSCLTPCSSRTEEVLMRLSWRRFPY